MCKVTVIPINCGFVPTVNYPRPVLVHDAGTALLYFTAAARSPDTGEQRVVAVCELCLCSKLGHPNDEALAGHALYPYGLETYGIFEVRPSPWMDEVKACNRVAFPAYDMPDSRHIIITLHDHTFECLTDKFTVYPVSEYPAEKILARLLMTTKEANQVSDSTPPERQSSAP
ncbi:hypothetical protein [Verrucomicrobium sp. BvORR106]|uniref:hypothetical protein n=1 Tax=Verrucomicrobium sp. BvORR106 TaxID=1403819 RepID=UPI00056DAFCC|nr:hypothetical protein [Verrucomicrobium sp. BvORR106]